MAVYIVKVVKSVLNLYNILTVFYFLIKIVNYLWVYTDFEDFQNVDVTSTINCLCSLRVLNTSIIHQVVTEYTFYFITVYLVEIYLLLVVSISMSVNLNVYKYL